MRPFAEAVTISIAAALAAYAAVVSSAASTQGGQGRASGSPQGRLARPNVVFVISDTTRADRFLGSRGAARWLRRQPGTEFDNAWSQAPTTNSAVATIFTGLLPSQHGVFDGGAELPRRFPTLAEHFQSAGYTTAHISGNPNSGPPYGLDRGFRHLRWSGRGAASDLLHQQLQHADAIGALALEFLQDVREPFLLSLHFNDPHSPYDPLRAPPLVTGIRRLYDDPSSDPSVGRVSSGERADLMARYDAEIAAVDQTIEMIVRSLERSGAWDRTVLVVTADHGEEFLEHGGWGHSHSLFPELLRIPLLIRRPGDGVRRVQHGRINQADLLPTLLDLTGLPAAAGLWGRSRAGLLTGKGRAADITVAEKLSSERGAPLRALVTNSLALIEQPNDGGVELYDRLRDPGQQKNLATSRPRDVDRLQRELARIVAPRRQEAVKTAAIDPDTLRHLQSLGYLQGRRGGAPAAVQQRGDDPAPAIRTILNRAGSTTAVWSALPSSGTIAADNSTRAFRVKIEVLVRAASRKVRLRFAAANHATAISDVIVQPEGMSKGQQRVTFDGHAVRRFPPGAVIESDPFVGPGGDRWVVSFSSDPLGVVRVSTAVQSSLTPLAETGSSSPSATMETVDGALGLIAIVDAGR